MTAALQGRAALVTGGSRGIGAAIARELAEHGADVAITYNASADDAATVVRHVTDTGQRSNAVQADSSDASSLIAAVNDTAADFGRLDILVNNAGVSVQAPLDDLSLLDVDRTLAVNVRAPFLAAQAAARQMTSGGRIINIGSTVTERTPFPGITLYSLSKSSLIGLTKGLARDLGPRGITANTVSPGPIDTDMNPADASHAEAFNDLTALGRYGTPRDVAAIVAFLATEAAGYITGANIAVDGGITA